MRRFFGDLLYDNLVIALLMTGFLLIMHCYLVRHYSILSKQASAHASFAIPYNPR